MDINTSSLFLDNNYYWRIFLNIICVPCKETGQRPHHGQSLIFVYSTDT